MLSKTDKTQVSVDEIRPIVILPHILKVVENIIKMKVDEIKSELFDIGKYQVGFRQGHSTQDNLAIVMNEILRTTKKRSERKLYCAIDLRKAYDSINRKLMFEFLESRIKEGNQAEQHLVNLIKVLYENQKNLIGDREILTEKGVL